MIIGKKYHKRNKLSNKLLIRVLLTYMLVALIPLIFGFYLFRQSHRLVLEREHYSVMSTLTRSRDFYDEAILSMNNLFAAVLIDSDLERLAGEGNPHIVRSNVHTYLVAQNRLSILTHLSSLVDNVIIYNPLSETAITPNTIILNIDFLPIYFENMYKSYIWPRDLLPTGGRGEEVVSERLISLPNETGTEAMQLYVRAVNWGRDSSIIIMTISPEKIRNHLLFDEMTDILVFNNDGMLLSGALSHDLSAEELLLVDGYAIVTTDTGSRFLVCSVMSNVVYHRFVSITPYDYIENNIASHQMMLLLILILAALTCIGLCIGFAWLNVLPLDRIIGFLFGENVADFNNKMNYQAIESSIRQLVYENRQISDDLSLHNEYLKSILFYDLLNDHDGNYARIVNSLHHLNIDTEGSFWVITTQLIGDDTTQESAAISLLIRRTIEQNVEQVLHFIDIGDKRFVILIQNNNISREQIVSQCHLLQSKLEEDFGILASGCIGLANSLELIPYVYRESILTLELNNDSSRPHIIQRDEFHLSAREAFLPSYLLQKISLALIHGEQEEFDVLLIKLYEEYFSNRGLTNIQIQLMWEHLYICVESSLLRISRLPASLTINTIKSLRSRSDLENNIERINSLRALLVPIFIATKKNASIGSQRTELGKKITSYIQEHLSNPELSLSNVADAFKLSTPYVSSLIKNETGYSYISYCERLRIAYACDLLKEGKSVQEVALAVGYYSTHTFRRVFKKIMGIVPSQYPIIIDASHS